MMYQCRPIIYNKGCGILTVVEAGGGSQRVYEKGIFCSFSSVNPVLMEKKKFIKKQNTYFNVTVGGIVYSQ